ncbi:MAG: hypothetical protein ACI8S6_003957 [Myxococcota bacterium]|jgi:hypothetical protein
MPKIGENHAYEQFFFTEGTTRRLSTLLLPFRRPLLLCTPSIAQALDREGRPYILLDRDKRFSHLSGYQRFDLRSPHLIFDDFDVIVTDPPFSNISLADFRDTVDLLVRCRPSPPPLFLCYIQSREDALLKLFAHHSLVRHPGALGYQSVSAATQARIFLYGPAL